MATTIITKFGSGAPAASDVVRGELAVDTENGRLYTETSGGAVIEIGLKPSGNIDVTGTVTSDGLTVQTTNGLGALLESTGTSYQYLQFKNTGETNNFIGFVNDDFVVSPANVQKLILTAEGRMGIGQTAPEAVVDIVGNSDSVPALKIGPNNSFGFKFFDSSTNGDLVIKREVSGTDYEVLRFARANGNVGIGTTSPDTMLHLSSATNSQVLRFERTDTTVVADNPIGIIEFEHQDATDAGVAAKIEAAAENASGGVGLRFETGTPTSITERMRIDSSGNVGIGGTPTHLLHVNGGTSNTLALFESTDAGAAIAFKDGNTTTSPEVDARTNDLAINTGGAERMRIDSSGNLLVGDPSATFNDTAKTVIRPSSDNWVIKPTVCTSFNRTASDGDILEFYKGSSNKVGSIGTTSGRLYIGDGDVALRFADDLDFIAPWNASSNAARDGAISLGNSSNRFSDLYLSGKTYLNTSSGAQLVLQTDSTRGFIGTSTSHALVLETAGTERARIDTSGNLLVGKTSTAFGTAGVEASASSGLWSTRSGFPPLALNRLSNDGSIVDFYKDGSTVGSIGTYSGDLWVGQGNTGLLFNDGGDVLRPANASGGNRDGIYDLGASDSRFKDLYLSGNAMADNFVGTDDTDTFIAMTGSNVMRFFTGNSERMRFTSDAVAAFSGTNVNPAGNNTVGFTIGLTGHTGNVKPGTMSAMGDGGHHRLGRAQDGAILNFLSAGSDEGGISISGTTVSYNGFAGRHESSGIPTNTLQGTVVSTIDELDVYPAGTKKAGQNRINHAKVMVSNSVGDSRVYGVVDDFEENGQVNVTSVGIAAVRVTGACSGGDLLESNGDGTAKVQDDDIIRSKTIGKVTIGDSDTGVKLVPCVLYCG